MIAVIEMSLTKWLVAGIVPGVERQPLKKLEVDSYSAKALWVRSSPAAVSSRTPRLMSSEMPSSWAINWRAKRLASSTVTMRAPLPSSLSSTAAEHLTGMPGTQMIAVVQLPLH